MNLPDKNNLRKICLKKRQALLSSVRQDAAASIMEIFLSAVTIMPGEVIAGYLPIRGEADVLPLLTAVQEKGAVTALPCIAEKNWPLVFRSWEEGTDMVKGTYDILEPSPAADIVRPNIILVPMLGFDPSGHRLGYGAGYYDRTLAALCASGEVQVIGIAFEIQKLDEIPVDTYDVAMDMIITESQLYTFGESH